MREVLRSSVNPWECDYLGHMNVRHYVGRFNDGLAAWLASLGFPARAWSGRGLVIRARDQHLRFCRELRSGAGYAIRAGTVSQSRPFVAYEEMYTPRGEIAATSVTELSLLDVQSGAAVPWPAAVLDACRGEACSVPEYAAVRGVSREPRRDRLWRRDALASGMLPDYLGPVLAEDCDSLGIMRESGCMARISDGFIHFLDALCDAAERPASVGGASLEYRFVFHRWPRVNDAIEVRSGLAGLGSKTLTVVNHIFDLENDECVASSQAVIAWFDAESRKAVALPDKMREQLSRKIVPGLTL